MSIIQTYSSAMARLIPALLSSVILASFTAPIALASPAEEYGLFKMGEGKFRWFGISIFTAQLWSDTGASVADLYDKPVMLSISYDWNVSSERFLKATRKEWQRLDGELDAREIEWLEQLAGIYPDIESGERLSSLVIPDSGTRFYLDDKEIGRVNDVEFGQSFLAIWLDENTRDKRVRNGLLSNLPPAQTARPPADNKPKTTAAIAAQLPEA